MSSQVSRTLLSILAYFNNALICMVSVCPLFSKSSSTRTSHLMTVSRTLITTGITVTFMFYILFSYQQGQVLIFLFAFSQFYYVVSRESNIHNSASSLFFVVYFNAWSSGRYKFICLYLKIPEVFLCLDPQE